MSNENKAILNAKINRKESNIVKILEAFNQGYYEMFYLILKSPFNNFWWECISITIQYSQLLIFILDSTVRKKYLNYYIVFTNLEK